ncbi:YqzE family protein [Bacillus sp. B190/17]|uniref:YqzE family protein n=1 Tax=Bacillus lumedeiriae TaxID=3058829 RepID=A0ABW8I540_9BACI
MNEYVKYFMGAFFGYLNEPKRVRKEKRRQKQAGRPAFSARWFGLLPWALRQLFHKK